MGGKWTRLRSNFLGLFYAIFPVCLVMSGEANALSSTLIGAQDSNINLAYVTPTRRLVPNEYPTFTDDLDFDNLETALRRQLIRFTQFPPRGEIVLGTDRYPLTAIVKSLEAFLILSTETRVCLASSEPADHCWARFESEVRRRFAIYIPELLPGDPRYGEPRPVFFTGYYTPHLKVSLRKQGGFQYPIYTKPNDDWYERRGRYEIDFMNIFSGLSLELFYAADLFDLYLLQVEGGGRVSYFDNRGRQISRYLSYAGSNGRQWRFLSSFMLSRNWIAEPTIPAQRRFISAHPELAKEIFAYCPGYVFFQLTDHPPLGSQDVSLTDNRSIATDTRYYAFKGLLSYVSAQRPRSIKTEDMIPFSRFVLDQDTGGAIRGKARVDFYFGEGEYAEHAASVMKERGDLYFLMLK